MGTDRHPVAGPIRTLITMRRMVGSEDIEEYDRAIAILKSWPRVERLMEALEDLLDGLDANVDERCGLSDKQWEKRIAEAQDALAALEEK